jgi:hypothetical protein
MLKDERRVFPRRRVALKLEGRTNTGTLDPATRGRVNMDVEDLSLGGLSAVIDQPLVCGSRLAVFFPPQHDCRGALAAGKILRCQPAPQGYRISLEFDRFPSARGRMPYTAPQLQKQCA